VVTPADARAAARALRTALLAAMVVVAALLTGVFPARASPAGDVLVICDREIAPYRALLDAFTKACDCKVRVIPPQDVKPEGFESRLKAEGVRAVLAVGVQARTAVEGLRELPVVLALVPQVNSWIDAHPNRHGIEMALSPRQHLETLRRVFPQAKRVGIIFDPAQSGGYVHEARTAAAALNLVLETREIAQPGELSRHLEGLIRQVDVLWLLPDPTVLQGTNLDLLLLASFETRVPLYGFARKYVEQGAIAAAHLDPAGLGVQAAGMIRRVSSPTAGAVQERWEYARKAQLILNQKVARKMGIVIDPAVQEGADVIH
jgi:putative ABC transport system substrate-binding protein